MNGDNAHHTGYSAVTPAPGSKGWNRVMARGCGGYKFWTDCGYEFDCSHNYSWSCDACPIGITAQDKEYTLWELAHQGPPRPLGQNHTHNLIYWVTPQVGAESGLFA